MKRVLFTFAYTMISVSMGACGGGGGGSSPVPQSTPTLPPVTAWASGTVVDRDSNAPLGGISVAIEPWSAGATPMPEGTTAPNGTFAFAAQPGHYLLFLGSNSPADTRATVHDNITLSSGTNALKAPNAPSVPTVTPPPSETSGNYRLMTLDTTVQTPCLQSVNQHRTTLGLQQLVPDEWLEENAFEINQAQNNQNMTTFPTGVVTQHEDAVNGAASCAAWIANDFNSAFSGEWSGYPIAVATGTIWYGSAFTIVTSATYHNVGIEEWGYDPRIDDACLAPMPSPPPTPGPAACDPVYETWP
ncbi:MAG: hypothetical protein ACXVAM_13315 [Vulcanimicrobiaceae bacterium]